MTRHISLYFPLNFSFLLMSPVTSDSGSCHCFPAFCVSCSCGNSSSSLWSLKRGSRGWQQAMQFLSCITPSVPYLELEERDWKTSEATEIWKRCFKMLLLSGASGNAPTCWEDLTLLQKNPASPSVNLLASPRSGTTMILGTLCVLSNAINITIGSPFLPAWDEIEGEQLIHALFLVIREFRATTLHLSSW